MQYAICTVAAAPVRKEDSHRSEMVNQLLFGEIMEVLEEKNEWWHIRSLYDQYEGWLTHHLVESCSNTLAQQEHPYMASAIINPLTSSSQLHNLPMGAVLTGFDEETRLLWNEDFKYHGTFRDTRKTFDSDLMPKLVQAWINAPYLWGGKTFMGVDCSGFVQTVYKVMGIHLLRDAWQQARQGRVVERLDAAIPGDLAFFQNEAGKIVHVGILMNHQEIVHASGKVRRDRIDQQGILHKESGKRTHMLHSVRRMI